MTAHPPTAAPPDFAPPVPRWLRLSLYAAAVYNLAWGAWVILFPRAWWDWIGLPLPTPSFHFLQLWQCIGMIVGVYGVGYLCAARDPRRHWPIVLVGLLGKVLGPLGFLYAAARGDTPWRFGLINLFNDLIWWAPFALLLADARRHEKLSARDRSRVD